MNKPYSCGTNQINLRVDNALQLSIIKEIEDIFTAKINVRKKMSKTTNKYVKVLDYYDKTLLVLSGTTLLFVFPHLLLSSVQLFG